MSAAVRASGLRRTFGDLVAVDGVDLDVQQNTLFCVVGPDAAGKTTLLRTLVGVLALDEGTVELFGENTQKDRHRMRLLIGYMSQKFSLYEDLTVAENIRFFASLRRVSAADRDRRANRVLEATGLAPFTKRYAGNLSGGMKQKLGLVCTLVHEPRVLFLDEPTNGVDPVSRREFWALLGELRQRLTVVIATPSLDEAERCDEVALMAGGKILRVDTPEGLREEVTQPVWELKTAHPFLVAEKVRSAMPSASVQLFGDRLHVVHDVSADALTQLLGSEGHSADVRRVPATLEDAYVQLVEGHAAQRGAP